MADMLQDFLQEAADLLASVDNQLVELERRPADQGLLNEIFRGFHTIKGGAGFLNAAELVTLCHLTESLFDKLRNAAVPLTAERMDAILSATQAVRGMFDEMAGGQAPRPADPALLDHLRAALEPEPSVVLSPTGGAEPDWAVLLAAVAGTTPSLVPGPARPVDQAAPPAALPGPATPRKVSDNGRNVAPSKDATIRVDTARLDQVLNLAGEIGLTKNRLTSLRGDILAGRVDASTLHALDQAVSQLDLLVADLQNAVMSTRMQPIGRLFQKYPRIARDLARQLGKDVELTLVGEDTEIDKTMIEDLADPLIHLIRNAVDHGVEDNAGRVATGKPLKSEVRLEARQEGEQILIMVSDDGRGMAPATIRAAAIRKGLLTEEAAAGLDDRQSLNLVFLPGFSTKTEISSVSGRGVGMDVVKTNIQKLNGTIDIRSEPGRGTLFRISLPLTMAVLPVLVVRLDEQPFALPISLVREIIPLCPERQQSIGDKGTLAVRGEILPVLRLDQLLKMPTQRPPAFGVLVQTAEHSVILGVDSFVGRDDAVIKSMADYRPHGISGVTNMANGQIVLILDMVELLQHAAET